MKYFGENKSNLDFWNSTSFLMTAVLTVLAATILLPLSAFLGESRASSNAVKVVQSAEHRRQNVIYESFDAMQTTHCRMKFKDQSLLADNFPNCRRAATGEHSAESRAASKKVKSAKWRTLKALKDAKAII